MPTPGVGREWDFAVSFPCHAHQATPTKPVVKLFESQHWERSLFSPLEAAFSEKPDWPQSKAMRSETAWPRLKTPRRSCTSLRDENMCLRTERREMKADAALDS
uniref:Uncharacterized protein n=1 Tax=Naja naja TaxID=35670 RepID=A0A8C6V7L4_NAJNA